MRDLIDEQLEVFQEKNPGIEVDSTYTPMAQYITSIELLYRQKKPPDIYRLHGTNLPKTAPGQGWLHPLDEFLTDEFRSRFPEGTFEPESSSTDFDGKIYGVPLEHPAWQAVRVFYYNPELLAKYGFDGPPETWSEFVDMAKTISVKGKSDQVYGYAMAGALVATALFPTQRTAGPDGINPYGVDLRTGRAAYADESMVGAVDLHRQLVEAEAMLPGWETMLDPDVRTKFAAGQVAMFVSAWWHSREIERLVPDLPFEVGPLPVPDEGRGGYEPYGLPNMFWGMSSQAKRPKDAWKLLDFFGSTEFHKAYYEATGVPSMMAGDAYQPDGFAKQALEYREEYARPSPIPENRGSEAAQLVNKMASEGGTAEKFAQIAFAAVAEGKPYEPAAKALDKEYDAFIDTAIKELNDEGVDVSREVLVYPDYDPLEGYQAS
jgi:multiple sugar transport system substrate-binding protein